jgi:Mg-chelatase subunit ChlD
MRIHGRANHHSPLPWHGRAAVCLHAVLVLAALLVSWLPGEAQPVLDRVVINKVAVSDQAPKVESRVSVLAADGSPLTGLPRDSFRVLEDGGAVPDFEVQPTTEPIAVLVLVDLSGSMKEPGVVQGQDRLQSARDVLVPFLQSTLAPLDWVGITGFHVATPSEYSKELTQDHGFVRNVLESMRYDPNKNTALLNTAGLALDQLQKQAPPGVRKMLLIVSDGRDDLKDTDPVAYEETRLAVANKAREYGIPIYTVGVDSYCGLKGPNRPACVASAGNTFKSDDVAWLAQQTGGGYIHYGGLDGDSQDTAAVEGFLSQVASQGSQYLITYPTHAAKGPHQLEVQVTEGGVTAGAQAPFASPFELPVVSITSPADGSSLDLNTGATMLRLEVAFDFPDGHPRAVQKVIYYDGGAVITTTTASPSFAFDWDVSGLMGPRTLKAEAYDTVIVDPPATSNPVTVQIIPLPTPTPTPPPVIEITQEGDPWWKAVLRVIWQFLPIILVGVVAVLLVLILGLRKQIAKGVGRAKTWVEARRTAVLGTRPVVGATVLGKLLKYPPDGTEYPITGRQVSFGSEPTLCDVHIPNDQYISGKHFSIVKEADSFYVVDENSRNGTALNRQDYRLPPGQRIPLANGSYLYVGSTILQFQVGNVTTPLPAASLGGQRQGQTG